MGKSLKAQYYELLRWDQEAARALWQRMLALVWVLQLPLKVNKERKPFETLLITKEEIEDPF